MKFSNQVITVQPPIGGISRRVGYQSQPPFTCYDCVNMWPTDPATGRTLLTTRAAQESKTQPEAFPDISGITAVNGLGSAGHPSRSMVCVSNGDIYWWTGSAWTAATGAAATLASAGGTQCGMKTFLQKTYIQPASTTAKPIVFDYDTGGLDAEYMVETAGTVPNGLTMFAVWQGALWAAGAPLTPGVLYASRVGDALDWDFAAVATDVGGAFFTAGENEGLLRGDITCIIPHTTDTLLVGTAEGIIALYGHPRKGGIIEDYSDHVIVGKEAWAKGPDNATYCLTQDGMIRIPPQSGAPPELISDPKIPDEMQFNAYLGQPINMAYDIVHKGFHISRGILTTDDYWWFDLQANGFFRMTFPNGRAPAVMMENPPWNKQVQAPVTYGTENGFFSLEEGGSETVTTEVYIGPIQLAPNLMKQGKIQQGAITFGTVEPTVAGTFSISVGASAIDALTRAVDDNPQFQIDLAELSAGSRIFYPKIAGNAVVIHVAQTSGSFSLDQMVLTVTPAGTNKMHRYFPPGGGSPPVLQT